ncbi:bifunctional 3-(3-hydroxy-phenyl)propionate/3-hydroxycinnamic acid hydroxylase MhpA [Mycobacterium bourgelatii]|uniref:Putative 3-(3-hydroxy-phenyl) propionate hydroxylase n=1 Tax=Mycobacterium bourgelatii TaxID=1273442 RepID=A0A7I9YQX8_MYCBU|nr:bifunctional 3-(3-hydroxy-phenyl)propionate/3-hydroxycinnamic acid hydroxylase [Mycobacterium bourgelatii]GFG90982.1 putative 3-(3-hydroxy-phenyl) propionate hydroxylase [Mycobacterium bourgelatii]
MNADRIPRIPVVIVGAGPTGITAATLLAQYGVDCLILERWPGVYQKPRAVHLDDEVYRILARLGIAGEFAAISRPTLGLRLLDKRFRVLGEFRRDPGVGVHGFPQANMFDQPELESLLRANLNRFPCAELRGGADVTDISPVGDGFVRVTFTDRSDGRVHQVDAEYVLGCDGANSTVRSRMGSTMRDLHFAQRWLVVDVATDADLHQWDGVYQVCDPVRAGTYMRIGKSRYRWEFQLLPGENSADFDTITTLHPLIAPWTTGVPISELTLLRVAEYTFRAQIADRWRRGNMFILGDAAHLTPPFIGQGMGAGVRDAMNLAWKVAAVHSGALAPDVLDTYEQERKPHTRSLIRLALNMGRAMTGGGRPGNVARHLVLPRLRLIPGLREKVVDSTTPRLRACALVTRSFLSRLPGTLCPNPIMPSGRRLDDVVGADFLFVTATPLSYANHTALRRRGLAVLTAVPGGDLANWLRRGRAQAALVRPDRTVMRTARDPAALQAWTVNHLQAPCPAPLHSV